MIEIKNLTKKYDFTVLDGVNLTLPDRGLVCITGESGSGKTTLLNAIGMNISVEGEIIYNGENIVELKGRKKDGIRSRSFSYVGQRVVFLENMSVSDNIRLMTYKDIDVEETLAFFNMSGLKNSLVKSLSGGERKRVALIMAYLRNTPVILADEPTADLDEDNAVLVMEVLKELSKIALVVVSSHMRELAKRYADKIYIIENAAITLLYNGEEEREISNNNDLTCRRPETQISNNTVKTNLTMKETFVTFVKCVNKNRALALSFAVITVLSLTVLLCGFVFYMNPTNDMISDNMHKIGVRYYYTFEKGEETFFGNKNCKNCIGEYYVDTEKLFAKDIENGKFKGRLPQKFGEYIVSDYFEANFFQGDAVGKIIEKGYLSATIDMTVCGVYGTGLLGCTTDKFDINDMKDVENHVLLSVYSDMKYTDARASLNSCNEIYIANKIDRGEIIAGRVPNADGEYLATADFVAYQLSSNEKTITREDVLNYPNEYLNTFGVSHQIYKHGMYSADIKVVGITDRVTDHNENRCYISEKASLDVLIDGYVAAVDEIDFQKEYLSSGYSVSPYGDSIDFLNIASIIMIVAGNCFFAVSIVIAVIYVLSVKEENGKFLRTLYLLGFTKDAVKKCIFAYITCVLVLSFVLSLVLGLICLSVFDSVAVVGTSITFLAYKITFSPILILVAFVLTEAMIIVLSSHNVCNTIIGGVYDRR
jgi:putative ABC transport system ATP-binding protein